ncbi:hypothetical protein [Nonlabens xiamenensis]|uniref:hypothetical protein n=1 Tax=Nonlabens xiamenensis TaxID=2341043 RepID=UPI000F60A2CB|nr:hypothetical protein [Nonlabens xiamenensis]
MPDPIKFNPALIKLHQPIKMHVAETKPVVLQASTLKFQQPLIKADMMPMLNKLHLFKGKPVLASSLKVPYLTHGKATEDVLYKINQPHQQEYLPAYEIGTEPVQGKSQFKISLQENPTGDGGRLHLVLHAKVPDSLQGKTGKAKPMQHGMKMYLSFNASGVQKQIHFTQGTKTAIGYEAQASVSTLNEFNQLYAAISDGSYQCKLHIDRSFKIGIPQPIEQPSPLKKPALQPEVRFLKRDTIQNAKGKFLRYHIGLTNWKEYPEFMFRPGRLMIAGRQKPNLKLVITDGKKVLKKQTITSSRQLARLHFAVNAKQPVTHCQVELRDLKSKKIFKSELTALRASQLTEQAQPQKTYTIQSKVFSQHLDFHFPDNLHTYIYGKTRNVDSLPNGFQPFRLHWAKDGKSYPYLQEQINPKSFFYLPDFFSLSRKQVAGFPPHLQVRFEGNNVSDLKAHLSFEAVSETNTARLLDALPKLSEESGIPQDQINFIPLSINADQLKLLLSYPGSNGIQERFEATTYLDKITDSLPPMDLDNFQLLLENLTSSTTGSSLLQGQLEIHIPNLTIEPVPLALDCRYVEDDMFAFAKVNRASFKVEITNTTDQLLSADAARISLSGHTASFQDLDFPFSLRPNASHLVHIQCENSFTDETNPVLELEWLGMRSQGIDGLFSDTDLEFSPKELLTQQTPSLEITNLIESSVSFNGINASLRNTGQPIKLNTSNLDFPMELAAGSSFYLDLPKGMTEVDDLQLNFDQMTAIPDKNTLYDLMVDTTVNNVFETAVPIRSFIPFGPTDIIKFMEVEFKSSESSRLLGSVVFTKSDDLSQGFAEKEMSMQLPIKDFVLNLSSGGSYLYRIRTVIQETGTKSVQLITDWRPHSGSLEITDDLLPATNQDI